MTELEKKLLLTKDEYDYLMERLGYKRPLLQKPIAKHINYYFDTDDLSMNQQNITCRIRLKDGKHTGTMKQHSIDSDHSTETDISVRKGLEDNAFVDMGLTLQGMLTTHRCIIWKSAYCSAMLDKNEYLGYTDYELEIEYSPEHEEDACKVLKFINNMLEYLNHLINRDKSYLPLSKAPCKSNRFFERKKFIDATHTDKENTLIEETAKNHNEEHLPDSNTNENVLDNLVCEEDEIHYSKKTSAISCMPCEYFNGEGCGYPYGLCGHECI